jgi:hypothetical protein
MEVIQALSFPFLVVTFAITLGIGAYFAATRDRAE